MSLLQKKGIGSTLLFFYYRNMEKPVSLILVKQLLGLSKKELDNGRKILRKI